MDDIGAGLGSAVEGSLFARALEPHSGAKDPHPNQPTNCLNCSTPLVGAYCHACGQEAHLHRSVAGFMHDLLHGALHFEGKLWRTLPVLVLRPGSLTRRYIAGSRARFVSPMALFLFSVFLMFAVFQALGITAPTDINVNPDIAGGVEAARNVAETERREAREDFDELPVGDPRREAARQRLVQAEQGIAGLDKVKPVLASAEGGGQSFDLEGLDWLGAPMVKKLVEKWKKHPDLMLYKLQSNSYKFSWLLVPLSVPFVWLLFVWKRRFNAYDHAIFVTYSLSFMSLLFVAISLLHAAGVGSVVLGLAGVLIPPLHLYKQMRGAYSLSRFSTIWRLFALSGMITVILGLFLQILLVLGAF